MKHFLLTLGLCGLTLAASAQIVTETVDFNTYVSATNNDLANKFLSASAYNPPPALTQVTTGGITGGAVAPPNDASYGNDYVRYASTCRNQLGETTATSICFKFNAALVNPNSFADPLDFFLDNSTANDGLVFGLRHDYRLSQPFSLVITAYTGSQRLSLANTVLVTGHWYQLIARFKPIGGTFNDQSQAQLELFDLGSAGTAAPVSVGLVTAALSRPALVSATSYSMGVMGTKWGGAELLDNFSFSGYKAGSLLATQAAATREGLQVAPNPAVGGFTVSLGAGFTGKAAQLEVVDLLGRTLPVASNWDEAARRFLVTAPALAAGTYVVRVLTSEGSFSRKLTVE